uniref:Uncharacterized protein n=1 Tax=Onchocerca volvulus TaxID=6282 RepID=A0A8R1TX49_ONCVO
MKLEAKNENQQECCIDVDEGLTFLANHIYYNCLASANMYEIEYRRFSVDESKECTFVESRNTTLCSVEVAGHLKDVEVMIQNDTSDEHSNI